MTHGGDDLGTQARHRLPTSITPGTDAIRLVEHDHVGEERLLAIGPDRHGRMLGLVAVPVDEPTRIIHADDFDRRSTTT